MAQNPKLRLKPANLESISKWIKEGSPADEIATTLASSKSKTKFIAEIDAVGGYRKWKANIKYVNKAIAKGSHETWNQFIKANPKLGYKEASEFYIELIENQSPWPKNYIPKDRVLKNSESFYMALDKNQPINSPGRFGTKNNIPSIEYVRNRLAVKTNWKKDCSIIIKYRVKKVPSYF